MHHETQKKVLPSVLILYLLAVRQNMFGRYDSTVELGSIKLKPGFNAELQIDHPWECGAISPKDEVENSGFPEISPPRFPFCTIPKTEKLGDENLGISSEAFWSNSEVLWSSSEVFHFRVFGLGYSAKSKPRGWKNSEFDQNTLRLYSY